MNTLSGELIVTTDSEKGLNDFLNLFKKNNEITDIRTKNKGIEKAEITKDTKINFEYLGSYLDIEKTQKGYTYTFTAKTELSFIELMRNINSHATSSYDILDTLRDEHTTSFFDLTIENQKGTKRRIVKVDFNSPGSVTDLETLKIIKNKK